ncbi:MAG: RDD family protein [Ruminococcus sp.]|nr:RDD family protein [Ruminococcus sp.]
MKSNIFKRVCAYLIDFIVITLISAAITSISFLNPKYEEYSKVSGEYNEILNSYYKGDIEIGELSEATRELSYEMNKNGYVYLISGIVVSFLYFGGFAFITKGQTLGKKIMRIKIVSNKDKELKLYNYLIRCFILNGIIPNIITLVAICFSKSTYFKIYNIGSNFDTILMIVIFLMIMLNKEERGLHDIIAGTKVIDLKTLEVKEDED